MGKELSDRGEERTQQRNAGKKSGSVRAKSATIRRLIVKAAFARLPRPYQMQPYSDDAIDALQTECTKTPSIELNGDDFDTLLSMMLAGEKITVEIPRETLKKDMKKLGIRSKLRTKRPG
jgi:hypothetical protein